MDLGVSRLKLKNLIAISKYIGKNLDLVQGAGGNTSVKDGRVLWVKASGLCLKDAGSRDIFVPVDYSSLTLELARSDVETITLETLPICESSKLRPSIETLLHAIMPHRYVIHVHSVNTIANAVLQNGSDKLSQLLAGVNWAWVDYVRPGVPLARAFQMVMHSDLNVVVLANHGLVLGGESTDQVLDLLNELERRMNRPLREPTKIKSSNLIELLKNTNYSLSKYSLVQYMAFDPVAISIAAKGPLYPDHIVFLGSGPMSIMSEIQLRGYLKKMNKKHVHDVIIVKGLGVLKHNSLGESAEEMLHCLANVILRLKPEEKLRHLTDYEQSEISGWDAEKFRQANQV